MTAAGVPSDRTRLSASDRLDIVCRHAHHGVPLTVLAEQTGIGVRTLQRWHSQFKKDGPVGLERSARSDRATRKAEPELIALVEGLALTRPRRSIATIKRTVDEVAEKHGWEALSYSVVRDIVTKLPPAAVALAQDGPASYRDRFELVWRYRADCVSSSDLAPLSSQIWPRRVWLLAR